MGQKEKKNITSFLKNIFMVKKNVLCLSKTFFMCFFTILITTTTPQFFFALLLSCFTTNFGSYFHTRKSYFILQNKSNIFESNISFPKHSVGLEVAAAPPRNRRPSIPSQPASKPASPSSRATWTQLSSSL